MKPAMTLEEAKASSKIWLSTVEARGLLESSPGQINHRVKTGELAAILGGGAMMAGRVAKISRIALIRFIEGRRAAEDDRSI